MLKLVGGTGVTAPPMRAAIVIPARFASSRFPGKPLVSLRGAGGAA
ncbi:cytidylyltransferase domain-containing protein, partial [Haemophilus influenzae]